MVRRAPWSREQKICIAIIVLVLALGTTLRLVGLQNVPLGLDQDEAVNGYDAYSLALTGSDHHGNYLPVIIQGFNDYRMALFDYSLVPMVTMFGLKASVVRATAALWGIVDITAITAIGGVLFGIYGAVAAAILAALSPWHLPWSRFGVEITTGMAVVDLAILSFLLWVRKRQTPWLFASGALFGLSFYAYAVTKLFTPLMVLLLCGLYWREVWRAWRSVALSIALAGLIFLPQAIAMSSHGEVMQQRYQDTSMINYIEFIRKKEPGFDDLRAAELLIANFASYFTPSYLFRVGDRGDHWTMPHPVGFGMLLPEQALLLLLALLAMVKGDRRKIGVLLAGWLILAAAPPALTIPMGVVKPDPGAPIDAVPSPEILSLQQAPNPTLTPAMLMAHPMSRRNLLACTPWILLSVLGLMTLIDMLASYPLARSLALGAVAAGVLFHSANFVKYYFTEYPVFAAPYFQYGLEQALAAAHRLNNGSEFTVVTPRINQPYIYPLFYDRYDPEKYQRENVLKENGMFAAVVRFDHYIFYEPAVAYEKVDHGVIIFAAPEPLPAKPAATIDYPTGNPAYLIVVK